MLRVHELSKTFPDGTTALNGASFEVKPGEFVVILGPSGSGKTTLLRSINGLVPISNGLIELDGLAVTAESLRQVRRKVGMIFQSFDLIGNLSALNNVLTGLLDQSPTLPSLFYLFGREAKINALECLDRVGLLTRAFTRADRLSGGQQQRVGIARAIVRKPALLLADEPVASLDPMIAFNVLSLLKDINRSQGITVICNLHQVELALRFADRIVGLAAGKTVLDARAEGLDTAYIKQIYKDHDQGMFFGPGQDRAGADTNLRFTA